MPRLDPTTRLHRERAARSLRWTADELRHVVLAHQLYLPRGMARELGQLGAQVYRASRLLDPVLLEADRRNLATLLRRAEARGELLTVAGLTLEELAELLHLGAEGEGEGIRLVRARR